MEVVTEPTDDKGEPGALGDREDFTSKITSRTSSGRCLRGLRMGVSRQLEHKDCKTWLAEFVTVKEPSAS
jgi:hypothetical protein